MTVIIQSNIFKNVKLNDVFRPVFLKKYMIFIVISEYNPYFCDAFGGVYHCQNVV